MGASLSDRPQGDSRGPGAGQGAGIAGAGSSSARGWRCTRDAGAAADRNSLDTAWKKEVGNRHNRFRKYIASFAKKS